MGKDRMDIKIRKISKEAAINDEAPMYLRYDNDKKCQYPKK